MIISRLYAGFISLLIVAGLFGCQGHSTEVTPGSDRLRVKTITQQVTSSGSVSAVSGFSYDGQGRLSSMLAYRIPDSTVAPVEKTVYQYDTQNRLIQVQHSEVRRGTNSETYTLAYNTAGQLAQLSHTPSTFSLSFQFNSANQLSGYTRGISVGGLRSSGGGSFSFTGNNLTSASEDFKVFRSGESPAAPPAYYRLTSTTYTFDDKLDPFYGVFIIPAPGVFLPFASSPGALSPFYMLYGGIDNTLNLSQNNVLSAVSSNGTTTQYSYTYNAANLPLSRTTTLNGVVTEVLRFTYESY